MEAIDKQFLIIQEYFESDLSLARFATNRGMTLWQLKWLLNKHKVPPKARIYRDRREIKDLADSYELAHEDEERHEPPIEADEDDFSGI